MADVLMMWDGTTRTVFSIEDFLQLVDEYMGFDSRRWLDEAVSELEAESGEDEIEELESQLEGQKEHHKEIMAELKKLSEEEASLISEKEIDRHRLSNVAGKIGTITWREINAV